MNKKQVEKRVKTAFCRASDGLFNDILADCQEERMLTTMDNKTQTAGTTVLEPEITQRRSKSGPDRAWRRPRAALAAAAAAVILVLGGVIAFQQIQVNRIATIVTLDLNPSIQLDANRKDQVLAARALNEDGNRVLKDMRLEKTDLNVAINAIMGSMLQAGYLADDINTFLVSVDNPSTEKSSELRNLISGQLETLMTSNNLDGLIISQKLDVDDDVSAIADQYGISLGKAYLLRHIHDGYPEISLDVLSAMKIGELADLFAHTIAEDDDVELRGYQPDDDQQQWLDRASVLAMLAERWKLDPDSIRSASIELEDDDQPIYVVVFKDGDQVHRAIVDAISGDLIREEHQQAPSPAPTEPPAATPTVKPTGTPSATTAPTRQPTKAPTEPSPTAKPAETTPRPTSTPEPTTKPTATPTTAPQQQMLSAAAARKMVINRFGGIVQKIEYAYDDTHPKYKGEALKDGYKVVFEINARTSSWAKWDVANDNSWDSFAHALPDMISIDQAARSVIDKSGQANTFVQKIDFLWDDEKPLYQGEAFNKGVKYSFEIYAYGGGYQKWDVSTGDETWSEKYYNVR